MREIIPQDELLRIFWIAMWMTGGASIVAEAILGRIRHGPMDTKRDRYSSYVLAVTQFLGVWFLLSTTLYSPDFFCRVIAAGVVNTLGLLTAWAGIMVRLQAKRTLGRFFTGHVNILQDHQLIKHGPYRYVRHPGYLGAILFYTGLPLAVGHLYGLLMLTLPSLAAYLYRIKVEEEALLEAFRDAYRQYQQRTARLIPFIW